MERTAHCQLQRQDSVGIPMAYPIAPTIERANIILRSRSNTRKMTLRRCSSWHLWRLIRIQRRLLGSHGWLWVLSIPNETRRGRWFLVQLCGRFLLWSVERSRSRGLRGRGKWCAVAIASVLLLLGWGGVAAKGRGRLRRWRWIGLWLLGWEAGRGGRRRKWLDLCRCLAW